MGLLSNHRELFLSEKHLINDHNTKDREFTAMVTRQEEMGQEQESNVNDDNKASAADLGLKKLKIPPYKEEEEEREKEGLKTPTCPEKRIPAVVQCPGAPRKPKTCKKRIRSNPGSCVFALYLGQEIDSNLFPTTLFASADQKNKKVKVKQQLPQP